MSIIKNYRYAEYSPDEYYFDMIDNTNRSRTWMDILESERVNGAVGIINLSYFSLSTGVLQSATKIHGTWLLSPSYEINGLCIDKSGRLFMDTNNCSSAYSFTEGCPPMYKNGVKDYNYKTADTNGSTHIGFKEDGTVCILLCDKDNGISSEDANQVLLDAGCKDILRMDGSWSSHGSLGLNEVCSPSEYRYDRLYLIIYKKNTTITPTHKITLDVYGNFTEELHPMSWAMVEKLQSAFNRQNMEAMIDVFKEGYDLYSELRAKQSNNWKANICLTIDADYIEGTKARVTSSSAGSTAGRNILAANILSAFKAAGMECNDEVTHDMNIIMLAKTNAVANFIRYNDELLSSDYVMDAAVEATVKGVCDYLGVIYVEPPEEPVEKTSFEKLKDAAIFPEDVNEDDELTYEELAEILNNLGFVD